VGELAQIVGELPAVVRLAFKSPLKGVELRLIAMLKRVERR
jgi:hypothetical protein